MIMTSRQKARAAVETRPVLQWTVAAIGGLATLVVIGVVLWEALQPAAPPMLRARIVAVTPSASGYLAEIEVSNTGRDTAAAVDVVGTLEGASPSTVTLDYVPARGRAKAWLHFDRDPARASLTVVGWSEP